MVMPGKQQLDRLTWQWAETIGPDSVDETHVRTAYRLGLKPCQPGACRRNCKGNPYCISSLGERDWLREIEDSAWHDITDPVLERRKKGSFVGLKNLGATCYVNTFLQVWFHNREFRAAIYRCGGESTADLGGATNSSQLICTQLQLVFALLQFSQRQYVDPTPFIESLGLDTAQQQDAQEFSKLFMSLLEESLRQRVGRDDVDLIKSQFEGRYSYVTRCSRCKACSLQQSKYYELDLNIKGHQRLSECIEEFLKEECLDGDNSYMCSVCACKQTATRSIQLHGLPPVLHLQLLRFVFDRRTGNKRKLNTYIQFPEKLNMAPYLRSGNDPDRGAAPSDLWYDLAAVLVHSGASAHSGHYVAQIRDAATDAWYRFNDETIECISSGRGALTLGADDSDHDFFGDSVKPPRPLKGEHGSRNAYMLVYRRRPSVGGAAVPAAADVDFDRLPRDVQRKVTEDNASFEAWTKDLTSMMEESVRRGHARQAEVTTLYSLLPAVPDKPCEWVATAWLQKYMSWERSTEVPLVDNKSLLCVHNRLDPNSVTNARCISTEAAGMIYTQYGGGPRLNSDAMCWDCVRERCREIHTKARIASDSKLICSLLKKSAPVADGGYWVGKASLRSWKRLALEQIHQVAAPSAASNDVATAGSPESSDGVAHDDRQAAAPSATASLVNRQVASSAEGRPTGVRCRGNANTDARSSSENTKRAPASETKTERETSNGRSSPAAGGENGCREEMEAKGEEEGEEEEEEEENVQFNEDLLCSHGALGVDESSRRLVPAELWHRLHPYFPTAPTFDGRARPCDVCSAVLLASRALEDEARTARIGQRSLLADLYLDRHRPVWGGGRPGGRLWVLPTDFLHAWRRFVRGGEGMVTRVGTAALLCHHQQLPYHPETIGMSETNESAVYIWPEEWAAVQSFTAAETGICVDCVHEDSGHVTFLSSPEVCEECCANRLDAAHRSRLNYESATIYIRKVQPDAPVAEATTTDDSSNDASESACKAARLELVAPTRRSCRQRHGRDENQIHVASSQTLRQLKLQIMNLLAVPPFDQHLSLSRGVALEDDKATLGSLQILPGDTVLLKVQQPLADLSYLDDCVRERQTEQGFKGTGLQG